MTPAVFGMDWSRRAYLLGLSRCVFLWIILVGGWLVKGDRLEQEEAVTREAKQLMDDFWQWRLLESPEFASKYGVHKYDHLLEEYTEDAFLRRINNASTMLSSVKMLDQRFLEQTDRVSLDVMADMLQTYISGAPFRKMTAYLPLRSGLSSILNSWSRELQNTLLDSEEGYENLISRYKALGRQADQMIQLTREATRLNYSWSEVLLSDGNISNDDYLREIMNTLIKPFGNMPNHIGNSTLRHSFVSRAKQIIADSIFPAINRLGDFMEKEYRPSTRPEVGVSALPNGRQMYEACLRWHLSVNMTASQVHELGLKEVDRIYRLMDQIKEKNGFVGDVRGYIDYLKSQSENMYNSSRDMMDNIHELLARIKLRMPEILHNITAIPMNIEEKSSSRGPLGSYKEAPIDESTAAIYFANTYKPETSARFNMMPVVLHETEPGHHVQATYKKQIDLPLFRLAPDYSKFYAPPFSWPFYTAYVEGWGLYSEYLGEELGLYDDPYGLLGRYSGEMLRACRLVVDTGIHAFGWSQERAQMYIANHTALSRSMVNSEVARYISWPGQSCAYKIGELKIKELRSLATKALGKSFDLRDFHHQVLSLGPVPLHILDSSIRDWIDHILKEVEPVPGPVRSSVAGETNIGHTQALMALIYLVYRFL